MQLPAPLEYVRATSVEHAITTLARLGEGARVIAGGHSLIPMMKLRLTQLEYLIDINDLTELDFIAVEAHWVRIGALTRHRTLLESDELHKLFPIFRDAERVIADPTVRNRGTLGGALCQADPSEDLSSVCTTVNAQCVIRNSNGERTVTMNDFYRGPYQTAVGVGELLTEIRVPIQAGGSSAYAKVDRRSGDWAIVAAGAALWLDHGIITDVRVGLAAVGPNTTGIPAISELLRGKTPAVELFAEAGRLAADHTQPTTDSRGTANYKRHLAQVLTERTLQTATDRILGSAA
jgi:aerobic carbon-monoxide dehydrogenase medium subunit